jgi:hypothetical protein
MLEEAYTLWENGIEIKCYCTFLGDTEVENPISCHYPDICESVDTELEFLYDTELYRCSPSHIAVTMNNILSLNKSGIEIL